MESRKKVLTVKDLLDQLSDLVQKNPDASEYQIANYSYDDYSLSYQGWTSACTEIFIDELPEDSEESSEGVDGNLISPKIIRFV